MRIPPSRNPFSIAIEKLDHQRRSILSEVKKEVQSEVKSEETSPPTEEAPGQPDGTQPATVPGAENPESEEVKHEVNLNTE